MTIKEISLLKEKSKISDSENCLIYEVIKKIGSYYICNVIDNDKIIGQEIFSTLDLWNLDPLKLL